MLADTMRSTSQPTRVKCRMEKTAMVTLFMSISNDCLLKSCIPIKPNDGCHLMFSFISFNPIIVSIVLVLEQTIFFLITPMCVRTQC